MLDSQVVEQMNAAVAGTGEVGVPLAAWSVLMRACAEPNPLQLHFDVKDALGYRHALITEHRVVAESAPAIGGRYSHQQILRTVGREQDRSIGRGRSWRIDVEHLDAGGTVVAVESYEAFGYHPKAAVT
ncbi:MAG TPA: hypothetical protein PLP95_12965 [Microthrixaceae bacterium]|nr:hypothetical protein [Microthrixaceae bacterium]